MKKKTIASTLLLLSLVSNIPFTVNTFSRNGQAKKNVSHKESHFPTKNNSTKPTGLPDAFIVPTTPSYGTVNPFAPEGAGTSKYDKDIKFMPEKYGWLQPDIEAIRAAQRDEENKQMLILFFGAVIIIWAVLFIIFYLQRKAEETKKQEAIIKRSRNSTRPQTGTNVTVSYKYTVKK